MSVDEARMKVRKRLEELVGVSGAEILMDRPPSGWSDVVTNHTLDLRFAAFEERSDRKFDAVLSELRSSAALLDHKIDLQRAELLAEMDRRFRAQAWMMISTIVAMAGVIVAAIRL